MKKKLIFFPLSISRFSLRISSLSFSLSRERRERWASRASRPGSRGPTRSASCPSRTTEETSAGGETGEAPREWHRHHHHGRALAVARTGRRGHPVCHRPLLLPAAGPPRRPHSITCTSTWRRFCTRRCGKVRGEAEAWSGEREREKMSRRPR